MPKTITPELRSRRPRHRSAYQSRLTSTRRVVSSPHISFLLTAFVSYGKLGMTQHSQPVNATSSTSRVILKARSFIILPSNNLPFLSICAPKTSLVSPPIMPVQHRASIFGFRLLISCRVLCLGQMGPLFCFIFLYCF